jgi:hypothetical protein
MVLVSSWEKHDGRQGGCPHWRHVRHRPGGGGRAGAAGGEDHPDRPRPGSRRFQRGLNHRQTRIPAKSLAEPRVGGGLIQNMSRPGGNSTGFTNYEDAIGGKWLELLKEGLPNLQRAFAMQDPSSPSWIGQLKSIKSAADGLALALVPAEVHDLRDIQNSIDAARAEANTGLVVMPSVFTVGHRGVILDLTLQHKLPAIYPFSLFVRDGGLMSYGTGGCIPPHLDDPYGSPLSSVVDHWETVTTGKNAARPLMQGTSGVVDLLMADPNTIRVKSRNDEHRD